MKDSTLVVMWISTLITIILLCALLFKGIDGVIMTGVVGSIIAFALEYKRRLDLSEARKSISI